MGDYVSIGFDVVADEDWDSETTDADIHAKEADDWTLSKEQLALFAQHGISVPPKVGEVARLLAEVRK